MRFFKEELIYLGHLVTPEGGKPDENKIKAVDEFPTRKRILPQIHSRF
jgi:hypothetical protein